MSTSLTKTGKFMALAKPKACTENVTSKHKGLFFKSQASERVNKKLTDHTMRHNKSSKGVHLFFL